MDFWYPLIIAVVVAVLAAVLPGFSLRVRVALLVVIVVALAGYWSVTTYILRDDPDAEAVFVSPLDGGEVAQQERIRGESIGVAEGDQLWLVVYTHDIDRYYPEAFPPERDGEDWALTTHVGIDGDAGSKFDLVAVVVGDDAASTLADYIESGRASGSWPGFDELPAGFEEIGRITVTRESASPVDPPTTDEERALASATQFLDTWVAGDYDAMCAHREPCTDDWPAYMRAFPAPVRDPQLGAVTPTSDGFRVSYELQVPDHGSLAGAFIETPGADRMASLLGLTGTYVTWNDVLELREVSGEYRVVPKTGDDTEGSSRIESFLFGLGLGDSLGIPFTGDQEVGSRLAHYWATFGVEFGLDVSDLEPIIAEGLEQYDTYLERVDDLDDAIGL